MELNADFSARVVVHAAEIPWVDSPMPGVQRRMLDRIGDEVARATTIVRYDPESAFSPHIHTGGEEFLVLAGVFQDEHGDFPSGSYIRNPPQSRHTPGSKPGCIIFVKLWQFDLEDRTHVRTHIDDVSVITSPVTGIGTAQLFSDAHETVQIEYWPANTDIRIPCDGGSELLVLEGDFIEHEEKLSYLSWLRTPDGESIVATTGRKGAKIWRKTRHLQNADVISKERQL